MDISDAPSWDTIIVGGGVAGLSAALMLGRARRRVLVIDSGEPRNRFAAHMHAVLGHEGRDPVELLRMGRADASAVGVEFEDASAQRVDAELGARPDGQPDAELDGEPGCLRVTTDLGIAHTARTLILASGITDRLPDIPGLGERWGTSVLHCPYCHGWEVRGRRLGVLATSPAALHQVQLVRQWSERIVFFTGLIEPVDDAIRARLCARDIQIVERPVVEVLGTADATTGVRLDDGSIVEVDAIFTGGTPEPHDRMLTNLGLDRVDGPMGEVIATDGMGQTSDPRIWAVGNVVNPGANVPLAMGTGSLAGAAVNAALVARDFDDAVSA